MQAASLEQTPARYVARLASQLRRVVQEQPSQTLTLHDLLVRSLNLPQDDVLLRMDLLMAFLDCTIVSIARLQSTPHLDQDERDEAVQGLRQMAKLLDPASYGTLQHPEVARILQTSSLFPQIQLAALLCREPEYEAIRVPQTTLAAATDALTPCLTLFSEGNHHPALKQITFDFTANCRYVLDHMELFGRLGLNRTLNRTINRIVTWHHTTSSPTSHDLQAIQELLRIIGEITQLLDLEGFRDFSLATALLLQTVGFGPKLPVALHDMVDLLHPSYASLLSALAKPPLPIRHP